jgi:hypothetical protein
MEKQWYAIFNIREFNSLNKNRMLFLKLMALFKLDKSQKITSNLNSNKNSSKDLNNLRLKFKEKKIY